jgi:hypothetical protein
VTHDDLIDEGIALYARGDGFEAHEVWERVWRDVKAQGRVDEERTLRAMIRLAAAMVKATKHKSVPGVLAHARGTLEVLEGVDAAVVLGVDVAQLRSIARAVEGSAHGLVDGSVEVALAFGSIARTAT